MFVPLVSTRRLSKRRTKGGGGAEEGGSTGAGSSESGSAGGSADAGGSISSPSSGSSSSHDSPGGSTNSAGEAGPSFPISSGGGSGKTAVPYGGGGGQVVTIAAGQPFSGRQEGGGTRGDIFGSRTYGSGYPGTSGADVSGRGFPYFFWPLSFGRPHLHSNQEYGRADNSSRPGGAMSTAAFQSNGPNVTVFRILSDSTTTNALITALQANCSSSLVPSTSVTASPYNETSTAPPQPEQVIQYYRASSIALSLDGYNNSAVFQGAGAPDTALPAGIDTKLLDCLNQTIGLSAPLVLNVDATASSSAGENANGGQQAGISFSGFTLLLVTFVISLCNT
ncbi:unnamed protein product [Mycena citricolor]|uniref:Uncharacterized protein n=1 Tax=Mycena citricolor TaxID=2018698 RepID=A0AAD2K8Y1_9AGAR|nr:unnamed protein product [Mycena citricolor]